jgi:hypothetical protein
VPGSVPFQKQRHMRSHDRAALRCSTLGRCSTRPLCFPREGAPSLRRCAGLRNGDILHFHPFFSDGRTVLAHIIHEGFYRKRRYDRPDDGQSRRSDLRPTVGEWDPSDRRLSPSNSRIGTAADCGASPLISARPSRVASWQFRHEPSCIVRVKRPPDANMYNP